ncbi:DEAD/DEAH box helicase family protein [Acetomicrobium hydrogeniformans]|uniref:Flagellar biosynthesis protein FlhF n=1 Tax=Acetomicrobium hydrogeniformans ATCC BAA-1850 TaxID=592015 RepID=A0A0T5XB80_9BACT|nr:DEAD/DEAH box helicase family protein [Acetomicrobium hydrogeniformans]KRT35627.1 SRP54-type protein, GTPase domain protein [Acetomicrobium hydrogeniformans ATCC BAA-1850]
MTMRVVKQIIYEVDTEQEAFEKARKKLGPEAVVLSSVPIRRGGFLGLFKKKKYIVTAGILEEEENIQRHERDEHERLIAFQKLLSEFSGDDKDVAPAAKENTDVLEISNEALNLSLEGHKGKEVNSSFQENIILSAPNEIGERQICETLLQVGFDPLMAMEIASEYLRKGRNKKLDDFLAESISVTGSDFISALGGKRAMFVGPTGVGKTTTIAKLAAIFALWHQKKVLLLGADTYRIAAVEQLRTYASILEVPMEVVSNKEEIEKALGKHDAEIVLTDLPGRNQKDFARLQEYSKVYEALRPDCVHLLIAANSSYETMVDVVEKLKIVPYNAVIFTKVDETTFLSNIFKLMKTYNIPLSYITTGQDVPSDIEIASPARLARLALRLESIETTEV